MSDPSPPRIDPVALEHQLQRLASLPEAPWLHQEVARRMAQKLDIIRLQPTIWIDWSGFLGGGSQWVQPRYPQAQRWVVEPHAALLKRSQAAPLSAWRRWMPGRTAQHHAQLASLSLPPGQVQLLWANMVLHGVSDLSAVLQAWRSALAPEAMVMFSCFGPDTVRELKALYRQLKWPAPSIDFLDMHDLGDALVQSGFSEPVMDMEHLSLNWANGLALLGEMRSMGGNCVPERFGGLRTPAWKRSLAQKIDLALGGSTGRPSLTFEIIYGHALVPVAQANPPGWTQISEASVRQMLRQRGSFSQE